MADILFSFVVLLIQLFLGILFAVLSVYFALRLFDVMTEEIDEIAELKRGNIAVALVLFTIIVSIATITSQGIQQFENIFNATTFSLPMFMISFIMAIVQLGVVLLIAVLTIYTAIKVLDTLTVGIDELKELKKGNIAVALLICAVIYTVSFIVAVSISGIENLLIFQPETLATLVGLK